MATDPGSLLFDLNLTLFDFSLTLLSPLTSGGVKLEAFQRLDDEATAGLCWSSQGGGNISVEGKPARR